MLTTAHRRAVGGGVARVVAVHAGGASDPPGVRGSKLFPQRLELFVEPCLDEGLRVHEVHRSQHGAPADMMFSRQLLCAGVRPHAVALTPLPGRTADAPIIQSGAAWEPESGRQGRLGWA